ncbi:piezo-type mechanosensitive ion channel homolog isoform X3 [Telopea speciosissima]|uniref:piezo-type mechanosensitive ion channel homolog isoform X3 n=1 Tax=Telopea speciosissima TaxID=54955 RepID=UPI001CC7C386|nr:piezo-type mechanosensitive ion channel homolog isoform X3 [Telopea speciosissima]
MGNFLGEFVLPLLLLTASVLNWSLISLVDLLVFLVIQFRAPKIGFQFRRQSWVPWFIIFFSLLAILPQVIFYIIWAVEGDDWSVIDSWWAKLLGYVRVQPSRSPSVIYFLVVQLLTAVVALVEIYGSSFVLIPWQDTYWVRFLSCMERLGTHLRVVCCLLLPAIQLVVGISRPSWASLPFFICSCVGLVDWSLTSNFLGLFRWWRPLLLYTGFNIALLYVYQLPIVFPKTFQMVADFIGFYKISSISEWTEIGSGLSLLGFYYMLSFVKCDLEEMDVLMSMREGNLTEQLLPSRHSFFIRESRSGVRHTNVLLRGAVFRTFSINFFTYGFPVSLLALSFWSFHFASLCAFGLLAYVGYILYGFPSLFRLHRLHGLVLVFILLWAASTYIFNVAFAFLTKKLHKDMEIWETVGLWHYPIPGFYLLAQFCLGILVALGNLVNNSVFLYLSDAEGQSLNDDRPVEEMEETKVLIVATIAWGLRKSSRAITLALIFLLATKPGFIHAIYMVFFLVYLLNHTVSRELRQSLILLCEAHFALLYILQLNMISNAVEQKGSFTMEILSQLGLMDHVTSWDFLEIAVLACFCAVHNHGFEMLFSFSAIVQHTPCPPFGFSILSAGFNKSVLLSVYASSVAGECQSNNPSYERRIATYLSTIGLKFLSVYRSCGTYIAFLTILIAVYLVTPNHISFGYLFFLLLWIIGRQLVGKTRNRLWFPLKVYSLIVFIFIYSLSIFSSFETWLSGIINLYPDLGYNPEASLLENVWESLAVLVVMQLYSYERRHSRNNGLDDAHQLEHGALSFFRRLLIWHSDKILYLSLFYASLSPVSAFGFLYLLGLVICSTLRKGSRVPSKLFLVYAGFLVLIEYLFQIWGKLAEMFPGQRHSSLSFFLGFQLFKPGFWGLESGLRGKVLVIVACILQYNVFHWMEKMPNAFVNTGKWEEPCPLFVSKEDEPTCISVHSEESKPSSRTSLLSLKQRATTSKSWPSFSSGMHQGSAPMSFETEPQGNGIGKYSFEYIWGSSRESYKWNKKRFLSLRKERFDMQKITLKIYLKFWIENLFNLLGLEINMIALLLASFAVLNVISILYIASLAACVLLDRRIIRKLWPMFVLSFATVLTLEYLAMWKNLVSWNKHVPSETKVHCHDCWSSSNLYFNYCKDCWLGFVVDDPQMLISYYVVFMLACFKLRSDHLSGFSGSRTYHQMVSQRSNASVLRDLSFDTKSLWTFLDYLRLYCYCHLLDLVLALILITGTLQYDILHLGYLGFALFFFRLRLEILKKKNKIFKFLRMYNFALIVLSLAYQSPFLGDFSAGKCETIDYIYEVIGFYKYDYGFRITSRSALVEIVIFMLVSLQSYMFSSQEFDYVSRYLEAEQIGALVHEQEKKAAWKTAQLQHIRKCEEQKHQRNLQVEKMKSEMLNLQIQLHTMNSTANYDNACPESEGLRRRRTTSLSSNRGSATPDKEESIMRKQDLHNSTDSLFNFEMHDSLRSIKTESPSAAEFAQNPMDSPLREITELEEKDANGSFLDLGGREKGKGQAKDNPLKSAVQLIGDGVSQVQSLGNQAVTNLVSFLNIAQEDSDSNDHYSSAEDSLYDEIESQNVRYEHLGRTTSVQSGSEKTTSEAASLQIGRIFRYIWSQIRSNNDLVCYCCFIVVFLWNFSILSMVYLAALFFYALCISTDPSYIFWVIMLIYTEVYILLQYLYQIIIQHCGLTIQWNLLQELGFPAQKITSSFVISTLPLFLVYLFTLLQSSITAKDGEWVSVTELKSFKKRILYQEEILVISGWKGRVQRLLVPVKNVMIMIIRCVCRYWKSLTQGAESPPYFVQLSMEVKLWPEDGIQPERVESGINKLLKNVHNERCEEKNPDTCHSASRGRVQSIERSQENPNIALAVFEVVYASPLTECHPKEWYKSLTPASDVAKEIITAQRQGLVEGIGFPYPILSVIGGGKREIDLYAYIFGADLAVFFLVAIFYQSVIKNNSQFLEVYQLEDQFPKEFVFILMSMLGTWSLHTDVPED